MNNFLLDERTFAIVRRRAALHFQLIYIRIGASIVPPSPELRVLELVVLALVSQSGLQIGVWCLKAVADDLFGCHSAGADSHFRLGLEWESGFRVSEVAVQTLAWEAPRRSDPGARRA